MKRSSKLELMMIVYLNLAFLAFVAYDWKDLRPLVLGLAFGIWSSEVFRYGRAWWKSRAAEGLSRRP